MATQHIVVIDRGFAALTAVRARAASQSALRALAGEPPTARFKSELVCIVDTIASGILVYRDEKRALMLPPYRLMRWAKWMFERLYLRRYATRHGR